MKDSQYHEGICPQAPVECKWKSYGCKNWRHTRSSIQEHLAQYAKYHMDMMKIEIDCLRRQVNSSQ